jgi:hypothetical protein
MSAAMMEPRPSTASSGAYTSSPSKGDGEVATCCCGTVGIVVVVVVGVDAAAVKDVFITFK